ncbi:ribonuclease Z [Malassezia vespertilionis]|uniref:ribonuclease Z n=1 Tax=Malassezia vespertilionis TaxID=2020962 RepID=A0A2N1J8F4_9BASI|nr:ribonuclease Z [Malassezia vespertilionis]PKI82752.1 hypothetical protein MVES_003154 [Malassezia vespertilionis]WFD08210.1 ribonuclease Z [Malassezia vespertilionis]
MSTISLRILAPPTSDTPEAPTLVVQCNATKYMFNAGEGTTRISAQRRASNSRVEHIFLSRIASETMGGVPGLLMTLADGGRSEITLHGPPNLRYTLAATRFYAKREQMRVHTQEIPLHAQETSVYSDQYLDVVGIPLLLPAVRTDVEIAAKQHTQAPGAYHEQDAPWRDPRWSPSTLCGADADNWYKTVIADAWGTKYGDKDVRTPSRVVNALPGPPLLPMQKNQAPVVAYICAARTQRGKFDAARAAAMGIPPGPSFSQLSAGQSVTIQRPVAWDSMDPAARKQWLHARSSKRAQKKNGEHDSTPTYAVEEVTVASAEVVGAARAGPVFFYMYLPTPAHVDALLQPDAQDAFAPYTLARNAHLEPSQQRTPHIILHAAPHAVLQDARYQAWMASFGPACYHLIANREQCADELTYTSSAMSLLRLSRLNADMFVVPGYTLKSSQPVGALERTTALVPDQVVPLQPRMPPTQLNDAAPVFNKPVREMEKQLVEEMDADVRAAYDVYCAAARDAQNVPQRGGAQSAADSLLFTTLGTGSSAPSKYRNVLSTLVRIPEQGYMVLDAGEGTYFQLARSAGPGTKGWGDGQGIETILRNLDMIFVSHIHGDHHMGVARLLLERKRLEMRPEKPLYVFANNYTRFCLQEYDRVEALGLGEEHGVILVDNEWIDYQHGVDPENGSERRKPNTHAAKHVGAAKAQMHLRSIRTAPVVHRTGHCYGLVVEHEAGWKLVFSGDTMPSDALVAAGRDATVLIHEATMQNDELELAEQKGHSTIGQAMHVAQRMRAQHLLLTHFSQRYPKFARMGAEGGKVPAAIAFDLMRITPPQIRQFQSYLAALESLFATEEGQEEDVLDAKARATTQRKNISHFEHRYVTLAFIGIDKRKPVHAPSELALREGITIALQETHGIVGGAFSVDILYVGSNGARVEGIVRVPSMHADALLSALSAAGPTALHTLTGGQAGVRMSVKGITHALPHAVHDSREWTKEMLAQHQQ